MRASPEFARPSPPPQSTRMTFTRFPTQSGGRYTRPLFPLRFTTFSSISCPNTSNFATVRAALRAIRISAGDSYAVIIPVASVRPRLPDGLLRRPLVPVRARREVLQLRLVQVVVEGLVLPMHLREDARGGLRTHAIHAHRDHRLPAIDGDEICPLAGSHELLLLVLVQVHAHL